MRQFLTLIAFYLLFFSCDEPIRRPAKVGPAKSVFISGEEGYACFRIPAILALPGNKLIAFAEGRKGGCSDTGDIDLVMKTSDDLGETWSSLSIIWDDSLNTCGNPAPVYDKETGKIILLSTWNLGEDHESEIIGGTSIDTRRIFVRTSDDLGQSWTEPKEITKQVKLPSWTWYATGPGSGLQLKSENNNGRLMIACDHIEAESKKYFSHIIYSDDHGNNWQLGGTTPKDQVNECEVVQLSDGRLMLNMRNYDRNQRNRQIAFSKDGGLTWEDQQFDSTLIEPICQASLHTYRDKGTDALLFSNPASKSERVNMSLRVSFDEGKTWADSVVLHPGPSAYSDIAVLENGLIGCLFEGGKESPYETIRYQNITFAKGD